jgi:hypothetical protein
MIVVLSLFHYTRHLPFYHWLSNFLYIVFQVVIAISPTYIKDGVCVSLIFFPLFDYIFQEELVYLVTDTEKLHDLQSAGWRPRKTGGVALVQT